MLTKANIAELYRNIGIIEGTAILMEEVYANILQESAVSIREILDMGIVEEGADG